MDTSTKIDVSKLLGYRLLAVCEEREGAVATASSAKLGIKPGKKVGLKVGLKAGLKARL